MPEDSKQGSPMISAEKVAAVLQPTQVQLTAVDSPQQQTKTKQQSLYSFTAMTMLMVLKTIQRV